MQAAIDSMTRSLALEWGYYGIRVSGIAPGWIGDTTGMLLLLEKPIVPHSWARKEEKRKGREKKRKRKKRKKREKKKRKEKERKKRKEKTTPCGVN